ncbi:MAG: diaminopimelate epimerase [Acidimicrobiales bacterium]
MRLTKHHGLGNDFLVLLDLDGTQPVSAEMAVALCERRTGLGADGLLVGTAGAGDADVTMRLHNADGSLAEMSGNGIRCLAQAVFQSGSAEPPALRVATDAGVRTVTVVSTASPAAHRMSVEMGQAKVVGPEPEWLGDRIGRALRVEVGNPHVVLEWTPNEAPAPEDLIAIGRSIDGATPGGANVEILLASSAADDLEMVVYERGVGPTLACGTGACAVAAAAHEWGRCGPEVTVAMPGGAVVIALGEPVLLTGDVASVAVIDVPWP